MSKPTFSGHDSFECRQFWLKKGYDQVKQGLKFNDEAVVQLGVGRNMVSAVKHWMKAYGLMDKDDQLTDFAHNIFSENGFDPFLEDEATVWLLHYKIVTTGYATLYSYLFNDLRKQRPEFTKDQALHYVRGQFGEINPSTLSKDFETLMKTYIPKDGDAEENYDGLLSGLHLIEEVKSEKKSVYVIAHSERNSIPAAIILYCILEQHPNSKSLNFETLREPNNVAYILALNEDGLNSKLEELAEEFKKQGVVYSNHAGVREVQFTKGIPKKERILEHYYHQVYAG